LEGVELLEGGLDVSVHSEQAEQQMLGVELSDGIAARAADCSNAARASLVNRSRGIKGRACQV
jgi:hypothetical protein